MSAPVPFPVSFLGDSPAFRIHLARAADSAVVAPEGDLDVATVDELRTKVVALAAGGCRSVVLDLSRLAFADSSEIHLLLELEAAAAIDGFAFAVRLGDATPARRLLDVAGLAERFASV